MPRKPGSVYPECWIHEPRRCPTCDKIFRRPREQKYCSQGCRRFGVKLCENCEEAFIRKSTSQRYCSVECHDAVKVIRERIYLKRVRQPKAKAARPPVYCQLPLCGQLVEDHYNGQKYHPKCYRKIHNLKGMLLKRYKRSTDRTSPKLKDGFVNAALMTLFGDVIPEDDQVDQAQALADEIWDHCRKKFG